MKSLTFLAFSLIWFSAFASQERGYCYDQALKYKNFMHAQVLSDIDLEGGLNQGEESFEHTQDRYALDNLEERYVFTIPTGNEEDGFTFLKYSVTLEVWVNTENTADICDVIKFSHEKTF